MEVCAIIIHTNFHCISWCVEKCVLGTFIAYVTVLIVLNVDDA